MKCMKKQRFMLKTPRTRSLRFPWWDGDAYALLGSEVVVLLYCSL